MSALISCHAVLAVERGAEHRQFLDFKADRGQRRGERFARGVADGDVPAGADLDALTSFYSSVLQGLSIQARDGASRQQLLAIGRCAMAAWDSLLAVEAA